MVRARYKSEAKLRAEVEERVDLAYLIRQRDDFEESQDYLKERIERQFRAEIDRKNDILMDSIYREISAGRSKATIARVLGMDRQALDYWIRRHGGIGTVDVEKILVAKSNGGQK